MSAITGVWPGAAESSSNGPPTPIQSWVPTSRAVIAGPGLIGGGTLNNDVVLELDPAYVVTTLLAGLTPAIGAAPNGYVLTINGGTATWSAPTGGGGTPSDDNPLSVGVSDPGISPDFSRGDHVHDHGNQAGGVLHAAVNDSAAGFAPALSTAPNGAVLTRSGNVAIWTLPSNVYANVFDVVQDGGADPTNTVDSLPAFQAAIASTAYYIRVPAGHYKMNGSWDVTRPVQILGQGQLYGTGSALVFKQGVKGVCFKNGSGFSYMSDLNIQAVTPGGVWGSSQSAVSQLTQYIPTHSGSTGGYRGLVMVCTTSGGSGSIEPVWPTTEGATVTSNQGAVFQARYIVGVFMEANVAVQRVTSTGWGGDGFAVKASSGDGNNANGFAIDRCQAGGNQGWGFYTVGADANGGVISNCTAISNGQSYLIALKGNLAEVGVAYGGFCDNSFLGNTYRDNVSEGNYGYSYMVPRNQSVGSQVNKTRFFGCYAEGGQVTAINQKTAWVFGLAEDGVYGLGNVVDNDRCNTLYFSNDTIGDGSGPSAYIRVGRPFSQNVLEMGFSDDSNRPLQFGYGVVNGGGKVGWAGYLYAGTVTPIAFSLQNAAEGPGHAWLGNRVYQGVFQAEQNVQRLAANLVLSVTDGGSNAPTLHVPGRNQGTESQAFATLAGARDFSPRDLNGFTLTINDSRTSGSETVNFGGFINGTVILNTPRLASCIFRDMEVTISSAIITGQVVFRNCAATLSGTVSGLGRVLAQRCPYVNAQLTANSCSITALRAENCQYVGWSMAANSCTATPVFFFNTNYTELVGSGFTGTNAGAAYAISLSAGGKHALTGASCTGVAHLDLDGYPVTWTQLGTKNYFNAGTYAFWADNRWINLGQFEVVNNSSQNYDDFQVRDLQFSRFFKQYGGDRALPTTDVGIGDYSAGAYAEIVAHAAGGQGSAFLVGLQQTLVTTSANSTASIRFGQDGVDSAWAGTGFGSHGEILNGAANAVNLFPYSGSKIIFNGVDLGVNTPASIPAGAQVSWLMDHNNFFYVTSLSETSSGDVAGPGSSTANALARFNGTTGKIIKNSSVTVDDSGNMATPGTVDGRDLSVDGAKLDGIEAGATNLATYLGDTTPLAVDATAGDPGVSALVSRKDHKHAHNSLPGGNLHAAAVAGVSAGFITAADQTKLDSVTVANIPTANEKAALVGTSGTPTSGSNKLVDNADTRLSDARAPTGAAGGDLGGTYPNPIVTAIHETSGPTKLTYGSIAIGQKLIRSGATIIGAADTNGDVVGPASATDNALARYDLATGKLIQSSLATVDDSGNIAVPALATIDGRDVSVDGTKLDTITVANIPSAGEKAALVGSQGTPGAGNTFVTSDEMAFYRREKVLNAWVNVPPSLFPTGTAVAITYQFGMYIAVGSNSIIGVSSDGGATWTGRPNPSASFLPVGLTFGGGTLICWNGSGNIIVTTDGLNWRAVTFTIGSSMQSMVYGNGSFVAVQFQNGGTANVLQSTDGITWNTRSHGMGSIATCKVIYTTNGFVITTSAGRGSWSADGITWTPFTCTASNLTHVAYGAGTYVTVGVSGTIYTSTAGAQWRGQRSNTEQTLNGVAFLNGQFIAWGAAGVIMTSPDGLTWTTQTSGFGANAVNWVDFGAGQYVAVGNAGQLASSPDGITWTLQTSGFGANAITKVRYLNAALFIAVGAAGNISTSPDGLTWTARTSGVASALNDAAFGNSTYVVVGAQTASIGVVLTSAAGVAWASQTSNFGNFSITGIIWDTTNSLFVAFGTNTTNVITSPNATAWTAVAHNMAAVVNDCIFANGVFTAVGASGKISTSPTGVTFTARTSTVATSLGRVLFANSLFVVVGGLSLLTAPDSTTTWTSLVAQVTVANNATTATIHQLFTANNQVYIGEASGRLVLSSGNGGAWTTLTSNLGAVQVSQSIAYDGSTYVVVGAAGALSTSTDGFTWTARTSTFGANNINQVIWALSTFVIVGAAGSIATSPAGGVTWTLRTSNWSTADSIVQIVSNGTTGFVAIGNHSSVGIAGASADGATWNTPKKAGSGIAAFNTILFASSVYLVGGSVAGLYSSTDGLSWTERDSLFGFSDIKASAFGASAYVIGGTEGKIASSTNGTSWTLRTSGFGTDTVNGILFAGGQFIAYGNNGKLSTSPDGTTWTAQTSAFGASAINKVIHNGTLYIAVGASGIIATSPDGVIWTLQTSNAFVGTAFNDIAYGSVGGVLVAVGTQGCVCTSSNGGTTWINRDSLTGGNLSRVITDGTVFMACVSNVAPGIIHSATGTTWSRASSFSGLAVTAIGYDGTSWYAYNTASVGTSEDRVGWKNRNAQLITITVGAATFMERLNGNFFIGGASNGLIRQV